MKQKTKIIIISILIGIFIGTLLNYFFNEYSLKQKAKAAYAIGLEEFENKNYHKAISLFSISIGLNPEWYVSYMKIADSYHMIGAYALSVENYKYALSINSNQIKLERADNEYISKQIQIVKEKARNQSDGHKP